MLHFENFFATGGEEDTQDIRHAWLSDSVHVLRLTSSCSRNRRTLVLRGHVSITSTFSSRITLACSRTCIYSLLCPCQAILVEGGGSTPLVLTVTTWGGVHLGPGRTGGGNAEAMILA